MKLKFLNKHTPFFYKNSFYKNHQAQNCQKIRNILRIMARLKYMIKILESPIWSSIKSRRYEQWNVFYLQWKVFNFEKHLFEINTQINQNTVDRTKNWVESNNNIHRNEWENLRIFKKNWGWFLREKLRINQEYFRVILAEFLRIARFRSDLCNSYKKNGVRF